VAKSIKKIGIVGTGVIGASWAACYLAHGFEVSASDPAPGAERRLRRQVARIWETLARNGAREGASLDRLAFDEDLAVALRDVDFVQENGPERLEVKRRLLADISAVIGNDVIIATSSSGTMISDIQDAAINPGRVVLGHPFNPPHLMPLVEVCGGRLTTPECIERTLAFYGSIGKELIHLRQEIPGHIANRLQAAVWREAFYLLDQGVASVADIDRAVVHGPGLRWALQGPFMNLHLAGGAEGIGHAIDHLGPPIESWWRDLGDVAFTPSLRAKAIRGIARGPDRRSIDDMVQARDDLLLELLSLKSAIAGS